MHNNFVKLFRFRKNIGFMFYFGYFYKMIKSLILFFFIFNQMTYSQLLNPKPVNNQVFEMDYFFGYDVLGSIYYLKNNILYKNDIGHAYEYKNIDMGKPTRIDIQNPLKIVLFYENFNSIIILDNQLNEIQKINFSENEIPINVAAFGLSSRDSFWIFNILDNKIGLFDYLKKEYKPISSIISGRIHIYQTDFNFFYFIDDNNNLQSCDVFGKLKILTNLKKIERFEVISNSKILYQLSNCLFLLDLDKNETLELKISEKTIENFSYKNQILSIFTNKQINNYNINLE